MYNYWTREAIIDKFYDNRQMLQNCKLRLLLIFVFFAEIGCIIRFSLGSPFIWFSLGCPFIWFSLGCPFIWFSLGCSFIWFCLGWPFIWFSRGCLFIWFSLGCQFIWFSLGCPFIWFFSGTNVYFDFLWCTFIVIFELYVLFLINFAVNIYFSSICAE